MAVSKNSRSYPNVSDAADSDAQGTAGGTLESAYMSLTGPWSKSNIWSNGNGSLSNGFPSRATTRDPSKSRDGQASLPASQAGEVEGKTGSSSLMESSFSDDCNRSSHGSRANLTSIRSVSQVRLTHSNTTQQRTVSNANIQQSLPGLSNPSSFASRPPTVNLNATSQTHPIFAPTTFGGGAGGRIAEQPPAVYTKFERPDSVTKKPDSAIGCNVSPTDTRRPSLPQHSNSTGDHTAHYRQQKGSASHLRQDMMPLFPPSYSYSTDPATPGSSRLQANAYRNDLHSHSNPSADRLTSQFAQLRVNGEARSGTAFRPATATIKFSHKAEAYDVRRHGSGYDHDEHNRATDEVDRNMQYLGLDGLSQYHSAAARGHRSGDCTNRYMQTSTAYDLQIGPAMINGDRQARRPPMSNVSPTPPTEWTKYADNTMAMTRPSPHSSELQPYMDPRMQQFLAAQLRLPYPAHMYNPYALANAIQDGGMSPYMSMLPMSGMLMPGMPDGSAGDGVQSALMFEFKSNTKTKRYELRDIYDHIAEFAGDQHGSRFIQTKLETANPDEKERVFQEIQVNALQLMTDVFGNYVIQKFFEHGDQIHKKTLANKMRGQVLTLSLQMYGCRVVQKALDHVLVDQQAQLVSELHGNVLKCVKDQNGNHVIQKAIERCPSNTISFIINDFQGQVQQLAVHSYGCRVIQRCLERRDTPHKAMIIDELTGCIPAMVSDSFGNYVVQHIVSNDEGPCRQRVLHVVLHGLEMYSKHKFASNVVEKCIEYADDAWRRQVVYALADNSRLRADGDSVLASLIKDQYGNYVVQKLLDTLGPDDSIAINALLPSALSQAKRAGCGKQLLQIEKRMGRFSIPYAQGGSARSPYGYQLPLLPPSFASQYSSAAGTPPPLTADTQSLQSSGLPSVNGDTVEGAAAGSRKASEPRCYDGHYR